mmetsp:Transcript_28500/g.80284  ORF Transcript_28500/g.80284 Transcript_28500/m.80284 type:complete len:420 (+) Transcript_28500:329-1588(+)
MSLRNAPLPLATGAGAALPPPNGAENGPLAPIPNEESDPNPVAAGFIPPEAGEGAAAAADPDERADGFPKANPVVIPFCAAPKAPKPTFGASFGFASFFSLPVLSVATAAGAVGVAAAEAGAGAGGFGAAASLSVAFEVGFVVASAACKAEPVPTAGVATPPLVAPLFVSFVGTAGASILSPPAVPPTPPVLCSKSGSSVDLDRFLSTAASFLFMAIANFRFFSRSFSLIDNSLVSPEERRWGCPLVCVGPSVDWLAGAGEVAVVVVAAAVAALVAASAALMDRFLVSGPLACLESSNALFFGWLAVAPSVTLVSLAAISSSGPKLKPSGGTVGTFLVGVAACCVGGADLTSSAGTGAGAGAGVGVEGATAGVFSFNVEVSAEAAAAGTGVVAGAGDAVFAGTNAGADAFNSFCFLSCS